MDARELEKMLAHGLKQDYSEGTEEFRDALLARCLDELDTNVAGDHAEDFYLELEDSELELLAAAGDLHAQLRSHFEENPS